MSTGQSINYEGRIFTALANSESGEVSGQTLFYYHQEAEVLWAEYYGGEVLKGFLVGKVLEGGRLEFFYQHINQNMELRLGQCKTVPELLPDGRLRLHEDWKWMNGGLQSGTSTLEEVRK
ncbi:MAG: n-acetylglutamate synthase [Deltaproteobacteria bacterium]|jgi:hypothetical protein|nr:n-acetylglutamate synthase [Deltaproteobacteria bacterium]